MAQINALLELRTKIKDRKPEFIRQDYQRRKRLGRKLKWRKPKGIHSKIRHHFKGRRKMPSPGYKSPAEVRGLHPTGLNAIRVFSAQKLHEIKKDEGILIPKSIGAKKRLEILKKAKEMNATLLNLKADDAIKKIEDFINSKKKKETKEAKKEPLMEIKKTEEQKEMTDEQRKEAEKKEKDKLLIKKV